MAHKMLKSFMLRNTMVWMADGKMLLMCMFINYWTNIPSMFMQGLVSCSGPSFKNYWLKLANRMINCKNTRTVLFFSAEVSSSVICRHTSMWMVTQSAMYVLLQKSNVPLKLTTVIFSWYMKACLHSLQKSFITDILHEICLYSNT